MQKKLWITDFGAAENILSTKAIQAAFDEATRIGNATVIIPAGTYITGTIHMGSASLYLEKGAVLKGSPNPEDYYPNSFRHNEMHDTVSLLYTMEQDGITIEGDGTIDMNGHSFYDFNRRILPDDFNASELSEEQIEECTMAYDFRPTQPLFFYHCTHIRISGIRILDAPCWTMSFHACENVDLENITIRNDPSIPNNDGMHFCGTKNVRIHACDMICGDDCIALSGITNWDLPCENYTISDCIMSSSSKCIVLGYCYSIVRNITISNCVIYNSHRGICIMTNPGGLIEHVAVDNLRIDTSVHAGNWWGNGEPICMFAYEHDNTGHLFAPPERKYKVNIHDIRMHNLSITGENIIAMTGKDKNIRDISICGISYQKKESRNLYIKGEDCIDVRPSIENITIPNGGLKSWLYVLDCDNVRVTDASVSPFNGVPLEARIENCTRTVVESF